jgi:hypothetical protein
MRADYESDQDRAPERNLVCAISFGSALSLPMYTKILTPVPTNFTLNVPGPLNWRSNLLVGTTLVIRPEAVAIGNPCGADKRLH